MLLTLNRFIELGFTVQPAAYQIANYNIYPTLTLAYNYEEDLPVMIRVSLVASTGFEFRRGFQSHTSWTLKHKEEGGLVQLAGLKLNKMGALKDEMKAKHLKEYPLLEIVL